MANVALGVAQAVAGTVRENTRRGSAPKFSTLRGLRARGAQFGGSVKGLHGVVHSRSDRSRSLSCRCTALPDDPLISYGMDDSADRIQPKFTGKQFLTKLEIELEIATSLEVGVTTYRSPHYFGTARRSRCGPSHGTLIPPNRMFEHT